ncbi:hypothetical protein K4A83_13025 [Spirulina subsalsa FACHB-351]|uniref:PH domain-containing protein n=1 Tax=Spirulina subsalsa FACHB-351 TaxID=234711 RepID=A0ABT3L6R0_9CYAN|nr:hypothetical protein [Spirulina subsalsa]MCW6037184.1 hypothetical protein [Spirulina subsalsa FACHB-351]
MNIFPISPIIRLTLLTFYVALTLPLPFLAQVTQAPVSPLLLWVGLGLGFVVVYALLSERVMVDEGQIQVTYPRWVRGVLRRGWTLRWSEIKDLKMRTTGQGGLVYYFITHSQEKAYLLPMRVLGFARLVGIVQEKTGIDTQDIRPLAQPWMYLILLGCAVLLLVMDGVTILTALG